MAAMNLSLIYELLTAVFISFILLLAVCLRPSFIAALFRREKYRLSPLLNMIRISAGIFFILLTLHNLLFTFPGLSWTDSFLSSSCRNGNCGAENDLPADNQE